MYTTFQSYLLHTFLCDNTITILILIYHSERGAWIRLVRRLLSDNVGPNTVITYLPVWTLSAQPNGRTSWRYSTLVDDFFDWGLAIMYTLM